MARSVNPSEPVRDTGAARRVGTAGGAARRQTILAAALELFRERGFHGTSINDIGARAGVTGPALYRHFRGKEDVLAEAIREGSRRIAAATREALADETRKPDEALEALVRAYVEVALENADVHAAYVLEARHLGDAFRRPLRRSLLRHREEWARLLHAIRPELGPEEVRTLVKMATFAVASLCLEPNRVEPQALIELATSQLMALLRGGA
jgi:AcrR family transcriptional regulator